MMQARKEVIINDLNTNETFLKEALVGLIWLFGGLDIKVTVEINVFLKYNYNFNTVSMTKFQCTNYTLKYSRFTVEYGH